MPFVSVTRLRIRSIRFLPAFLVHTLAARRQARLAPGYRVGGLLADRAFAFWTMTLWADEDAMRGYMMAGAHRRAMPHLMRWCDEASVVHWVQGAPHLPDWTEADRRMRGEGRASRLLHPAPTHAGLDYRPPRTVGSIHL